MDTQKGINENRVEEIIRLAIVAAGADGLCHPETHCGCGLDVLGICRESAFDCEIARKTTAGEDNMYFDKGDTIFVPLYDE